MGIISLILVPCSYGQWSAGTGFLINGNGYILTNHHLVRGGCSNLLVSGLENDEKLSGSVVATKEDTDLALIKIKLENDIFSFVRMKEGYKEVLMPELDERVHTLGFPDGEYGPRGGLVEKRSDPKLGAKGFTISMSTEGGASGSPVLDKHGLLLGIVWGGRDYKKDGNKKIEVYATKNSEIRRFLKNNKVRHGTSTIEDFPFKKDGEEGFFEEVKRVLEYAGAIVLRIYCKK